VLRAQLALQVLQAVVGEEARLLPEQALVKECFELELAIQTSPLLFAPELRFRVEAQFSISRPLAFLELIQRVMARTSTFTCWIPQETHWLQR
jgi:hypothetical protein